MQGISSPRVCRCTSLFLCIENWTFVFCEETSTGDQGPGAGVPLSAPPFLDWRPAANAGTGAPWPALERGSPAKGTSSAVTNDSPGRLELGAPLRWRLAIIFFWFFNIGRGLSLQCCRLRSCARRFSSRYLWDR
jgi:hypothetical protein